MMEKKFFDVPVYRLNADTYYAQKEEKIEKELSHTWRNFSPPAEVLENDRESRERYFEEKYGSWEFNEIIGYIRLYFFGTQVRGEYYSAEGKRVSLGRHRVFKFKAWNLGVEKQIWGNPSNAEIYTAIDQYLDRCQKELRHGRHIDRRHLDTLGPHINWRAFFPTTLTRERSTV